MASDLPPLAVGSPRRTTQEVLAAVGQVRLCIELCGRRCTLAVGADATVLQSLGDALCAAGVVLGKCLATPEELHMLRSRRVATTIAVNGVVKATGSTAANPLGGPVQSLVSVISSDREGLAGESMRERVSDCDRCVSCGWCHASGMAIGLPSPNQEAMPPNNRTCLQTPRERERDRCAGVVASSWATLTLAPICDTRQPPAPYHLPPHAAILCARTCNIHAAGVVREPPQPAGCASPCGRTSDRRSVLQDRRLQGRRRRRGVFRGTGSCVVRDWRMTRSMPPHAGSGDEASGLVATAAGSCLRSFLLVLLQTTVRTGRQQLTLTTVSHDQQKLSRGGLLLTCPTVSQHLCARAGLWRSESTSPSSLVIAKTKDIRTACCHHMPKQ
jgi:hypothetical protein